MAVKELKANPRARWVAIGVILAFAIPSLLYAIVRARSVAGVGSVEAAPYPYKVADTPEIPIIDFAGKVCFVEVATYKEGQAEEICFSNEESATAAGWSVSDNETYIQDAQGRVSWLIAIHYALPHYGGGVVYIHNPIKCDGIQEFYLNGISHTIASASIAGNCNQGTYYDDVNYGGWSIVVIWLNPDMKRRSESAKWR